jgi:hypothetical protein
LASLEKCEENYYWFLVLVTFEIIQVPEYFKVYESKRNNENCCKITLFMTSVSQNVLNKASALIGAIPLCCTIFTKWLIQANTTQYTIRGNKRSTRYNRLVFYCKTYCLLNMFRAPLCQSSGALELYRWLLPVVIGSVMMENVIIPPLKHYIFHLHRAKYHRQQPYV